MRRHVLAAVLTSALGLAGCEDRQAEATWSNASGSVALSRDDAFLYAVDADTGVLSVVDTARGEEVGEVKVGRGPERVVVGPDDTIYVSNRAERSVSVIRRGDWTESARIPVGVEPMGLAVSPDGGTLYVVNSTALDSTEHGTLMAVDTRSLTVRWELPVGEEPRGIALVDGGKRALISLFRHSDLVTVDLSDSGRPRVRREGTDVYSRANVRNAAEGDVAPLPQVATGISFRPRGMADVVVTPNGERAFAPVLWAREDPLGGPTDPNVPSSGDGALYGGGGIPCSTGGVVAPGLLAFDTEEGTPLVDDLDQCRPPPEQIPDFPPSTIVSPEATHAIQGPVAAVVDPSGLWIFVVNRETDNVAVIPTDRRSGSDIVNFNGSSVRQLVRVGSGPSGIAIRRDGRKAYVHNAFDHTVTTLVSDGSGAVANVRAEGAPLKLVADVLEPQAVAGRKLFYSALDTRMTSTNVGASCASCHLDGRDDGHVWGFPDGPRQTPSLAGRQVTKTGPFHWSGEFPTMRDFLDATVRKRMGGSALDTVMVSQLSAFIDVIPTPDNPYKREALTGAQARGAQVFKKAACDGCHEGETLTNNKQADVGTFITTGPIQDDANVRKVGLNTPSLLGLARTAPYLHDGSATSLKARFIQGRQSNAHGATSQLTEAEIDDLVEYLRTL
ncbi:c-type cytochrome [Pyxidicoccus fallax]|uniref:C-type cytochrome n=1 Tax=Pyxidicoccus fallax TaxID=394095 RepID=A0A848LIJ9_9BACT|nr:c-type cytochrome [Pyxidicoccus fallax]NMO17543.1 c-type cytochrome [Pyxidicoccus fallax]NPC78563.1 c-type cytochrome [Pyxidicoccus fallax]